MSAPLNSVGGFNTGPQRSWVIVDNTTGLPVDFGGDVMDLQASPNLKHIEINPISNQGYPKYKTQRTGWKGTLTVARNNANADLFESVQEALFHAGGTQRYFTIVEKTNNDDGTSDEFEYSGAEFFMDDSGAARMENPIEMKFGFNAQAKQPV